MKWEADKLRSPLGRARNYGAAGSGVGHWMHQRLTAISNFLLIIWLVWSMARMPGWDYATVTAWLSTPVNAILMVLAILSVFYHAVLGTQVITEDYTHNEGAKIAGLAALRLVFIGAGVACIFSVLRIAFAG